MRSAFTLSRDGAGNWLRERSDGERITFGANSSIQRTEIVMINSFDWISELIVRLEWLFQSHCQPEESSLASSLTTLARRLNFLLSLRFSVSRDSKRTRYSIRQIEKCHLIRFNRSIYTSSRANRARRRSRLNRQFHL